MDSTYLLPPSLLEPSVESSVNGDWWFSVDDFYERGWWRHLIVRVDSRRVRLRFAPIQSRPALQGNAIEHLSRAEITGFPTAPCSLKNASDGNVNVMLMQDWRILPYNTTITFSLLGAREPSIPARLNDVFECVCCRFLRV